MAKKTDQQPENPQLTVPAALSEVAKGVVSARAIQPGKHASDAEVAAAEKDAPPQRSRAELQADIAATRAELADVVDQIEAHLDVPARAKGIRDDFRADPVAALLEHKRTTVAAAVLLAGIVTGAVLAVRAIRR